MGEGLGIETCVFVGNAEALALNIHDVLPGVTVVRVRPQQTTDGPLWSSLGFASEAEFNAIQDNVDLLVTSIADNTPMPVALGQTAGILEHACGMDVIVMVSAGGCVDGLGGLRSLPIVSWLGGRVLVWRHLPGGVAISHGQGTAESRSARLMAELLRAAEIGVVVSGVECWAGPGPVGLPSDSEPSVFLAAPGTQLGYAALRKSRICAAVLQDSGVRRFPSQCFDSAANLSLVGLPGECVAVGHAVFCDCRALAGIDLQHVEEVGIVAFNGCGSLSQVWGLAGLRSIDDSAFAAVNAVKMVFGSVARVGRRAFEGSSLEVFSGEVDEWGRRPFDNCRHLQRLEMWPGSGFDALDLAGHAPPAISFRGGLGEARALFEELLVGSPTPIAVSAEGGGITGGRAPSAVAGRTADGPLTALPRGDAMGASVRSVNLSGVPPGGLNSTLAACIWVEAVVLPRWLGELPREFFSNCRSLRAVNVEECGQLRAIMGFCFERCSSLSSLGFPDGLVGIDAFAFASSGVEALDLANAKSLATVGLYNAHWLASIRLPGRLHRMGVCCTACRVADASGGVWDDPSFPGLLRGFRSTAVRGSGGGPWPCLVSARVTGELAAVGGRSGVPALPG